jgi:CRP-like cAMP-binding protein
VPGLTPTAVLSYNRRVLGVKDSKLEALKTVPLFTGLSRRELAALGRIADELDVRAGKTLIAEGSMGRQFFALLEGEAEVRRGRRKLNTLVAGDFFGEISLISKRPATATVTTTSASLIAVVTQPAFMRLLRTTPGIQLKVLQALAERVPIT